MAFETDSTTSYQSQEDFTESSVYTRKADGSEPQRQEGDSSDEIDPRKLMSDPTVDRLRWLARTSFGGTIVEKPVKDAFKHGFEIEDEDASRIIKDEMGWLEAYKDAQIKARRDGFALIMGKFTDNASAEADPLDDDVEVRDVNGVSVITLDDLVKFDEHRSLPVAGDLHRHIPDYLKDDDDGFTQIEVRKTGIVVDRDPQSDTYKEPLGYLVGHDWENNPAPEDIDFVHRNRILNHLVWNRWVDGDIDQSALGRWEGDSVLTSSYHILSGLKKGNWSIMQTVFRYASKLYHVEMPEDADDEDFNNAQNDMVNMNSMSELITPAGYEINDYGTDGQLEPEQYYDVLFDQVCASNEMTKSVLFGTQTGTVSGSETDIKNYFNMVERIREDEFVNDMHECVRTYKRVVDGRTGDEFSVDFDVDWGPLFKMTDLDQAETLTRQMQTLSAAINSFVMTPSEARNILSQEWAAFEIDEDEDELSDEEREFIESIQVAQMGAEASLTNPNEQEGVQQGSTQQQNGGGREQGETSDPDNPTADALPTLTNRDIERIAERVAEIT